MIHRCYILDFVQAATGDLDLVRLYRRREVTVNGKTTKQLVPCRFSQQGSQELVLALIRGAQVTHRVYFDANPNLREDSRLEMNNCQYILLGVPTDASLANRLWQVDVKMVTQQNENVKVIE